MRTFLPTKWSVQRKSDCPMPASSTSMPRDSRSRIRVAPEQCELWIWPLRQQPLAVLTALAAALGVGWLIAAAYERAWLGALTAGLLLVAGWRMWLPVTYELGASGVCQVVLGRRRRIPWAAVACYAVRGEGVLLVPDIQVAPLSPLRGLYVPWRDQRDQVLASVEYYLQGRGG